MNSKREQGGGERPQPHAATLKEDSPWEGITQLPDFFFFLIPWRKLTDVPTVTPTHFSGMQSADPHKLYPQPPTFVLAVILLAPGGSLDE